MITKYVSDIANQSGITLSSITLVDGHAYGRPETYLLQMFTKNRLTTALIFQSDLDELRQGKGSARLASKISSALRTLQLKH